MCLLLFYTILIQGTVILRYIMFMMGCTVAGVVLGMTLPVIYVKYENKIKEYGWRSRMQFKRYYELSKEKLKRMRSRVAAGKKQKKTE